jgi:hypothetical protein
VQEGKLTFPTAGRSRRSACLRRATGPANLNSFPTARPSTHHRCLLDLNYGSFCRQVKWCPKTLYLTGPTWRSAGLRLASSWVPVAGGINGQSSAETAPARYRWSFLWPSNWITRKKPTEQFDEATCSLCATAKHSQDPRSVAPNFCRVARSVLQGGCKPSEGC